MTVNFVLSRRHRRFSFRVQRKRIVMQTKSMQNKFVIAVAQNAYAIFSSTKTSRLFFWGAVDNIAANIGHANEFRFMKFFFEIIIMITETIINNYVYAITTQHASIATTTTTTIKSDIFNQLLRSRSLVRTTQITSIRDGLSLINFLLQTFITSHA